MAAKIGKLKFAIGDYGFRFLTALFLIWI